MKIAVAQISCSLGDPKANLSKVRDFSQRAKEAGQQRETSGTQLQQQRHRPYHVYFEAGPGVLARDFAKFPNEVLWKIAEKMRNAVGSGIVSSPSAGRKLFCLSELGCSTLMFPWLS